LVCLPKCDDSPHARSGDYNPRLDLVLFVNGIPTATLELKSTFKQSIENAKRQYRYDPPLMLFWVLEQYGRIKKILAAKGYRGDLVKDIETVYGVTMEIANQARQRSLLPRH
jgi:hypothetical protein